jgi:putative nucleotidyltransferase with HDIG domain
MPTKSPKPNLTDILAQVDQLPQPPEVAMKLSRMLESPNVSANQMSQVIQMDPGMTGQVLKVCNSSAFGLSRRIETIKEAVAMVGLNSLKSMVYTIISQSTLDKPVNGYDLPKGALWQNAATCALYAKHLSQRFGQCDPELAYTGSILRDIGKLVLEQYVGPSYLAIEQQAIDGQTDFETAETQVLGFSHTDVGEKVALKWNLPDKLRAIIRYHHQPSHLPEDTPAELVRLTAIVHMADTFTMLLGSGLGGDGLMYNVDTDGLTRANIPVDDTTFEQVFAELLDVNQQVKGLLETFGAV